jgi:hypothetical protein
VRFFDAFTANPIEFVVLRDLGLDVGKDRKVEAKVETGVVADDTVGIGGGPNVKGESAMGESAMSKVMSSSSSIVIRSIPRAADESNNSDNICSTSGTEEVVVLVDETGAGPATAFEGPRFLAARFDADADASICTEEEEGGLREEGGEEGVPGFLLNRGFERSGSSGNGEADGGEGVALDCVAMKGSNSSWSGASFLSSFCSQWWCSRWMMCELRLSFRV